MVISVMGLLAGIGITAVKGVIRSFESSDRVTDMVAAALSNARALAMASTDSDYVGVRFQRNADGDQYMIFIEQDDNVGTGHTLFGGMAGFRAVKGRNPIRLPSGGSVMDLKTKTDYTVAESYKSEDDVDVDTLIDDDSKLLDAETFSIVFNNSGKLIFCHMRVGFSASAGGDIFNTNASGAGMFLEDEFNTTTNLFEKAGLQLELSRNKLVIIDKLEFDTIPSDQRWSKYLSDIEPIYINPYTGELID